ncbi:uncharacterized protein [Glycine max]|uniref:uncharacterized protein n=1 Tax=Glycine max TaxID=3847 RepID=UPI0003DEA19F|nr:uncharacterized protein LOC102664072 [Glycine max]|eukprot:XP_006590121.1 uncharacterized protein LOC102664072 [Glycine max]
MSAKNIWKKRSIFFDLPYWCNLDVRHCLDVMHVEKNVCDSLIDTLLNIKGKTKDGVKSRQDLVELGIREQLHPVLRGARTYLPPACYTMSTAEKKSFCHCLANVKVPQGYSSNMKRVVELKLIGLKSHDCHVLMQQLLPVAIRGILPEKVCNAITRLCFFFNAICSKVIDPSQLDILENEAAIIVCQLEMLCGPVYLRWMYPVERFMKMLKGYTKNQYSPEASIVERYVAEEAIEFSSNYISNVQPVGVPQNRHQPSSQGRGTRGFDVVTMNLQRLSQAHLYVLNNTTEVMSCIHSHKNQLSAKNPRMNKMRLLQEHNRTFVNWFRQCIFADATTSETLRLLALGPNLNVPTWQGYDINGYAFYTKSQDARSTMQNSGVSVEGEAAHFSSVFDNNPINASMTYYGVIEDIWELDYGQFRVPVFSCRWVHANTGVRKDKMGFTLVDLKKGGYNDEPFIMAVQARQVFYVEDPSDPTWSVVIQGRKFDMTDYSHYAAFDVTDMPPVNDQIPVIEATDKDDVEHAMRHDHHEGLWENNDT